MTAFLAATSAASGLCEHVEKTARLRVGVGFAGVKIDGVGAGDAAFTARARVLGWYAACTALLLACNGVRVGFEVLSGDTNGFVKACVLSSSRLRFAFHSDGILPFGRLMPEVGTRVKTRY